VSPEQSEAQTSPFPDPTAPVAVPVEAARSVTRSPPPVIVDGGGDHFCRGLFQYGDLHFGQTRGSSSGSGGFFPSGTSASPRGTQAWLHRSQRKPHIVTFTRPTERSVRRK